MLLELFLGVCIGALFMRSGLPSIFPLLIWIPLLGNYSSVWGVIGLACAGIIFSIHQNENSSREDIFIGFIFSFLGLFIYSIFFSTFSIDFLIFPVLLFALLAWLVVSFRHGILYVAGGLFMLVVGWWLLHERVISFVLPAFFSGWWGVSWFHPSIYCFHSRSKKIVDSIIGCVLGILPGLGPGLVNALWLSGKASPALGVSNLIFSIGLLAQNGHVRSAVAAELGDVSSIPWFILLAGLAIGLVLSFFLSEWSSLKKIPIHPSAWFIFQLIGIILVGGILPFGVVLGTYSLRRVFNHWNISSDTGVFILLPSILWFYRPF